MVPVQNPASLQVLFLRGGEQRPCSTRSSHLPTIAGGLRLRATVGDPRLLVLGVFNIHVEAEISSPALEFLETMASLDMSQHVNGPTQVGGRTLDLVFSTERSECGLMMTDFGSAPLSWSDHHLIKCNLSVALPLRSCLLYTSPSPRD